MTHYAFKKTVWDFYKKHARNDLPWRKGITLYKILVSEIMLQQTQADRVIPFFKNWMKQFPNFKALAEASQSQVLREWKGLGYNSRALRLHKLAKLVTGELRGKLPKTRNELEALPGIGPYTAGAILAFAYNAPMVFIETNIRTVYLYHFFKSQIDVHDDQILKLVEKTLPLCPSTELGTPLSKGQEKTREWYWALMDYGSFLKRSGVRINNKSKHYAKQSKFEGSDRQLRGKILEILLEKKKINSPRLIIELGEPKERVLKIASALVNEGFLSRQGNILVLTG